jgi:hypothetical protein
MTDARPAFSNTAVLAGGISLIGGAIAFMGVFSYLAAKFQYPDVLSGPAADVLPALLATGSGGRAAWAFYSVLPLCFLPAGVGAYEALGAGNRGTMRIAMLLAFATALTMMLGLMRWPSMHWQLAQAWGSSGAAERTVLTATFDGLNSYLGNYIGEFLGEFCCNAFFLLSGQALLRHRGAPRWLGWWGIATAVLGLIGLWRNVTPLVSPVAAVNNYLLPAWMIGFGIWLVRNRHTN